MELSAGYRVAPTYGSSEDTNYGEEPDLIAAQATNGKQGYINKEDLFKIDRHAANLTEANQIMKTYNAKASKAFADSLSKKASLKVRASSEKAQKAYEESMAYEQGKKTKSNFEEVANEIESDLGIDYNITERSLDEALLAAQEANAVTIPVYELDGKTQIGVFECF